MKKPPIFIFKKINDKWKRELNPEFAFWIYTTHGIPLEFLVDMLNDLPETKFMMLVGESWKNRNK